MRAVEVGAAISEGLPLLLRITLSRGRQGGVGKRARQEGARAEKAGRSKQGRAGQASTGQGRQATRQVPPLPPSAKSCWRRCLPRLHATCMDLYVVARTYAGALWRRPGGGAEGETRRGSVRPRTSAGLRQRPAPTPPPPTEDAAWRRRTPTNTPPSARACPRPLQGRRGGRERLPAPCRPRQIGEERGGATAVRDTHALHLRSGQ